MGKAHVRSVAGRDSWRRSSGTRLALRACVVVVAALATLSTGTTVAVVQRAAAASCSTCGQNLILNPSAEAGHDRPSPPKQGGSINNDSYVGHVRATLRLLLVV